MHAIQVRAHGGPEVLRLTEVPVPEPGAGEVLVRLEAAGVNFIDVYHRTGLYPVDTPFIPGMEGAGVVEAVGDGVTGFAPGDRVAYAFHRGSYAAYAAVPAFRLVHLPHEVDARTGAAVMLQGMTAHYLSHSTYPLGRGKRALVHAAAGGVGLLLIQMAKQLGATVYGTVSTEEKAELARRAGADQVILYTREDFRAATERLTDGRGVHVVYDSVGQATFEKSLDCLAPRGMLVLFGQSSGPVPPVNLQVLARGSFFVTRPVLGHYILTRDELLERAGQIFAWLAAGSLEVRVHAALPLGEAAEAHRLLEGRKTAGKLLLVP